MRGSEVQVGMSMSYAPSKNPARFLTSAHSHDLVFQLYDNSVAIQLTINTSSLNCSNKHGLSSLNAPDVHVTLPIGKYGWELHPHPSIYKYNYITHQRTKTKKRKMTPW